MSDITTITRRDPEWAEWDRENTAYHEAGHAVAYLARGYDFRDVTIVDDGWKIGQVRPKPGNTMRVWDVPFVSAAGPICEQHHYGRPQDDDDLREDFAWAQDVIDGWGDEEDQNTDVVQFTQYTEDTMWGITKYSKDPNVPPEMGIVTDRRVKIWRIYERELTEFWWPAVEDVATALLERDVLTYDEASQIFESAMEKIGATMKEDDQ
jgi:hypothetical protein